MDAGEDWLLQTTVPGTVLRAHAPQVKCFFKNLKITFTSHRWHLKRLYRSKNSFSFSPDTCAMVLDGQ